MSQNTTEKPDFTIRQSKAIAALVQDGSVTNAAEKVGVSRGTLHRWMADEAFNRELSRRRAAVIQTSIESISAHVDKALATLVELLDCECLTVRRGAARDILDLAVRVGDVVALAERLDEIEKLVDVKGSR